MHPNENPVTGPPGLRLASNVKTILSVISSVVSNKSQENSDGERGEGGGRRLGQSRQVSDNLFF